MKSYMVSKQQTRKRIVRLSFLFSLLIFILLQDIFLPMMIGNNLLYNIIIATISTFSIYDILFDVFYSFFEKRLADRSKISGAWHQILVVNDDNPIEKRLRTGKCTIECTIDDILVQGTNIRYSDNYPTSRWKSKIVDFENNSIVILYENWSPADPEKPLIKGIIILYAKDNMNTFEGVFRNIMPPGPKGILCLFREQADAEEYIKNKLKEDKNSSEFSDNSVLLSQQ